MDSQFPSEGNLFHGTVNAWEQLAFNEQVANTLPKNTKGRRLLDAFTDYDNILPREFSDLSHEVKERMVKDPAIGPGIEMAVNVTLSKGWRLTGGKKEIRKYLQRMFDRLNMDDVFEEVLTAFWVGFSVTEKVFDIDEKGKWFISKYRPLPPESIQFEMTDKGDVAKVLQDGGTLGQSRQEVFFPKRVNIYTYKGGLGSNFGDPRGVSVLERLYDDYWSKVMIRRMKDQHLELGAGAILVGNAGLMSVREMLAKVEDLRSGAATVLREGQSLMFIQPEGDGEIFLNNLSYHDKRMREGLLNQLFFGQDGNIGSGTLPSKAAFELLSRVRIQRFQQQLMDWVQPNIKQVVDMNWGEQDEYTKFSFMVATEEELVMRAERDMRLVKMGVFGKNDIDYIRIRQEAEPGDPGENLLLEANPSGPTSPGKKDNTVGDSELKDNDSNFTKEADENRADNGVEER